jgi:hypothetical protein
MYESFVSVHRIGAQLQALHEQEQDALARLSPGCPLALHEQIVRLISRIREDKNRLRAILKSALAEGREYVSWNELQGRLGLTPEDEVGNNNVIEFPPRPS